MAGGDCWLSDSPDCRPAGAEPVGPAIPGPVARTAAREGVRDGTRRGTWGRTWGMTRGRTCGRTRVRLRESTRARASVRIPERARGSVPDSVCLRIPLGMSGSIPGSARVGARGSARERPWGAIPGATGGLSTGRAFGWPETHLRTPRGRSRRGCRARRSARADAGKMPPVVAEAAGGAGAFGAGRAESPVAAGEGCADEAGPAGAIAPVGDARIGATGAIPRVIPGVSGASSVHR